ncbi:7210_t:CDS:1, partial [Dentiscutata heterogama]
MDNFRFLNGFSRIYKSRLIIYSIIIIIYLKFSFFIINENKNEERFFKNYNPKTVNYNQDAIKKYNPKFNNFNRNVIKERASTPLILSINKFDINDPNSVSLIQLQIGSNPSQKVNLIPDISSNDIGLCNPLSESCNSRKNIFISDNSTSFKGTYKPRSINYLDGSSVSGFTGNDFITFNDFTFKDKFSLILFDKINGALQSQSAVEGVMGLGFGSQ